LHNRQGSHAPIPLPEFEALAYLGVMPNAARHSERSSVARCPETAMRDNKPTGAIMIDSLVNRYRSWRKYRSTYEELMKLSSRELDDLGISRSEIPNIARRVAL
jgi:uncharacterized protein YjiS (DUF1127 family)